MEQPGRYFAGNVAKSNCMLYAVDDAVIWKQSVAGQH